jgi:hypothetical protein
MSGKGREIAIGFCAAFAAAFVPLAVAPANASKPVPKTIVGCVFKGNLISSDGYEIRPRYGDGRTIELQKFEGRGVSISGDLLPGDAFILNRPPRDTGPCKIMRPAGKQ